MLNYGPSFMDAWRHWNTFTLLNPCMTFVTSLVRRQLLSFQYEPLPDESRLGFRPGSFLLPLFQTRKGEPRCPEGPDHSNRAHIPNFPGASKRGSSPSLSGLLHPRFSDWSNTPFFSESISSEETPLRTIKY